MNTDQDWFDSFFSAVDDDGILRRRESNMIEFKESFNWEDKAFRSKIAHTAAAFANNKGGVIIFGIANNPHKVVGINNIDAVDGAVITTYLNEHFSPHISYERKHFTYQGNIFDTLVVAESKNKPIICIKDSPKTNDSDIYFRYGARSSKIKSGDLMYLIQDQKRSETDKWMNLIQKIASIGVENIGVLNTSSGELFSGHNKFIIDESILSKIKFLDKYSQEHSGSPAVRIIGDVVESAAIIEKPRPIYEEDVFKVFLTNKAIASGKDYLESIIRQHTEHYPIYFFMNMEVHSHEERILLLESIKTRARNKSLIIKRLSDDSKLLNKHGSFSFTGPKWGRQRQECFAQILSKSDITINSHDEFRILLEALFSLNVDSIDEEYVKKLLLDGYEKYYPLKRNQDNYIFRWTITYIDNLLYRDRFSND